MSERKTIKVNPAYFSLKPNKNKTEKKREKKQQLKTLSQLIKPSKAKRELLRRIKEHQKQRNKEERQKQKETRQNSKDSKDSKSDESVVDFTENVHDSMKYLQRIIQENKRKRSMKHTRKVYQPQQATQTKTPIQLQTTPQPQQVTQTKTPIQLQQQPKVTIDFSKPILTHQFSGNSKHQQDAIQPTSPVSQVKPLQVHLDDISMDTSDVEPTLVVRDSEKPLVLSKEPLTTHTDTNSNLNINTQTNSTMTSTIKQWNTNERPEPKYGCLKNGSMPTYSQYMKTLKKKDDGKQILPNITISQPNKNVFLERKEKLKNLIQSSQTSNHSLNTLHRDSKTPLSKYKRYKVRKLYKTFKIGKNMKNKSVGVLLKNNKTKKKVLQEMNVLRKVPIPKVKAFLREKNMLKYGSSVPDSIVRETFINSVLSGDITNKNMDVMVHNYFQ